MLKPDFSQIEKLRKAEFQAIAIKHQKLVQTKGSFLGALSKQINQSITVQLIDAFKSKKLHPFEKEFNHRSNQFYCREVLFMSDKQEVGFARSALCLSNPLREFEKQIIALKNQSMGTFLYQFKFNRTPFIPLKLITANEHFMGRSSIYSFEQSQLMISEIWPNSIANY